jgi:hypothetical protein
VMDDLERMTLVGAMMEIDCGIGDEEFPFC